jgi:hypothetical protein
LKQESNFDNFNSNFLAMVPTALINLRIGITSKYEDLCEVVLPGAPEDPKKRFVAKNSKQKISRYCPFKEVSGIYACLKECTVQRRHLVSKNTKKPVPFSLSPPLTAKCKFAWFMKGLVAAAPMNGGEAKTRQKIAQFRAIAKKKSTTLCAANIWPK